MQTRSSSATSLSNLGIVAISFFQHFSGGSYFFCPVLGYLSVISVALSVLFWHLFIENNKIFLGPSLWQGWKYMQCLWGKIFMSLLIPFCCLWKNEGFVEKWERWQIDIWLMLQAYFCAVLPHGLSYPFRWRAYLWGFFMPWAIKILSKISEASYLLFGWFFMGHFLFKRIQRDHNGLFSLFEMKNVFVGLRLWGPF